MIFNKKLIIKIIAAIFLFSILIAAILWFFSNKQNSGVGIKEVNLTNTNIDNSGGLPSVPGGSANINNTNSSAAGTVSDAEISVLNIESAAIFVAERLGSYSTDTDNFNNLKGAQFLMTEKMKMEVDNMIDNYSKNLNSNNYYGVTTKALSVEVLSQSDLKEGIAKVVISTQKVETINKNNPTVKTKYQKMEMVLRKDGKWLVDSAVWK